MELGTKGLLESSFIRSLANSLRGDVIGIVGFAGIDSISGFVG